MIYSKKEIQNANLHIIKTDKFKTITVNVRFKRPLVKEEITKRNFLVNCLMESTKKCPTRRLLEIESEELYNLGYRIINNNSGTNCIMSFDISFLNPKYTEDDMLDKSFKFLSELIYGIDNIEDRINDKNFNISRNILMDNYDTLEEDPMFYAQLRMFDEMDEPYVSYRQVGYREYLENITKENIFSYYKEILEQDKVDIFVLGDVDEIAVTEVINKYFKFENNNKEKNDHFYNHDIINDEIKFVNEKTNKNQSVLVLGLNIDELTDYEKRYVLNVYNYILGGSTDSNLFKTVREENSLCYTISSSCQFLLSTLLIRAGINADDYEKTISLIHSELENLKNGNFDEEKINNAKTIYISSLTELEDNPDSIINLYTGMEYLNSDTVEKRKEYIMKVTKDDVISVANKIHLNVIYLLEGSDKDEE